MAYPWELEGDDPRNYGLLAAGGALLTPERMGGGMGPAVSQFGRVVANQKNIDENQQLTKLKIDAYKRNAKNGMSEMEGLPAKVKEAIWYDKYATPEQKKAYLHGLRDSVKMGKDGRWYHIGPGGTMEEATPFQLTVLGLQQGAAATAFGKESVEAQFKLNDGVDPQNKPITRTTAQVLADLGQTPRSPFSAMAPGATPGPAFNPAMARVGPPAQQAPQQVPQDYPATRAGLEQARTDLAKDPVFGGGSPPLPGAVPAFRPAAAGAAQRAKEKAIAEQEALATGKLHGTGAEISTLEKESTALLSDPGLKWIVGMNGVVPGGIVPDWVKVPGTSQARAMSRWDKLKGGLFKQAYNELKGAGQIAFQETQGMQGAMSRMDRSLSEEDFKEALTEYVSLYKQGVEKIRLQSGGAIEGIKPITEKKASDWPDDKEQRYQEYARRQAAGK